jgi:hypothetical protein
MGDKMNDPTNFRAYLKFTIPLAMPVSQRIETPDQAYQYFDRAGFIADSVFVTTTATDVRSAMIVYKNTDSFGRPCGIFSRLNCRNMGGGLPVPPQIKVPGCDPKAGLTRGHLLGGLLGGSGLSLENLTPMYRRVNVSQMKRLERQVKDAVCAGETVDYRVTPIFEGDSLIPRYIKIEAKGDRGLEIKQTLENKP